jgi:hypothetical protein
MTPPESTSAQSAVSRGIGGITATARPVAYSIIWKLGWSGIRAPLRCGELGVRRIEGGLALEFGRREWAVEGVSNSDGRVFLAGKRLLW